MKKKTFEIRFQGDEVLFVIKAKSVKKARAKFNAQVSIKQRDVK